MHNKFPTEISLPRRLFAILRGGDWLMALLFILLATGSFWAGEIFREGDRADQHIVAVVTVNNRPITTLNLQTPSECTLQGTLGEISLGIANNRIRVLRSRCPNQVCVRQGEVYRPGEMLVCVPNHLIVFIRNVSDPRMISGNAPSTDYSKSVSPRPPPDSDQLDGRSQPVKNRGDAVTY